MTQPTPGTRNSSLFFLLMVLTCSQLRAQVFELDQLKHVPSIHEANMRSIAMAVWPAYEVARKTPELTSTTRAAEEVVFNYYDTDFEGQHEKLYPLQGKPYECSNLLEVMKNDRLLFNLEFNAEGNLVVPDTIYVISHRIEEKNEKLYPVSLTAFALYVGDSSRKLLEKVALEYPVKSRLRNPDGSNSPVAVKVPFNLARRETKKLLAGNVITGDEFVDVIPVGYSVADENQLEVTKAMAEAIGMKLLQYKQGRFNYVVEREFDTYQVDINIRRNNTWLSQQTKNFTLSTYKLVRFDGTGEKTKQYLAAERTLQLKLNPPPAHTKKGN